MKKTITTIILLCVAIVLIGCAKEQTIENKKIETSTSNPVNSQVTPTQVIDTIESQDIETDIDSLEIEDPSDAELDSLDSELNDLNW
jgi:PBP1b-binding outer membrane lipoprotein LpoB